MTNENETLTLLRLMLPLNKQNSKMGRLQEPYRYILHSRTSGKIAEFSVGKIANPHFINGAGFDVNPETWRERLAELELNQVNLLPTLTSNRDAILAFVRDKDYALVRRHVDGHGVRFASFTLDLTEHPPEDVPMPVAEGVAG